ncbi:MAG: dihydroorotase [bacterium]|nr:dihydroorotase [bacterium]
MSSLLIRNGRVVDPKQRLDQGMDLLIEDGFVAKLNERIEVPSSVPTIEASSLVVAPGFIDLEVRLGEPGFEYRETIETGVRAAVAGGFTAICSSPETDPVNDEPSLTRFIAERGSEIGLARVFPIGAVSKGCKGLELAEMGEMQKEGAVACSDGTSAIQDAQLMRRALEYSRSFDLPIAVHPMDESLSQGGSVHEGEVSTRIGLRGIPAVAEEVMVSRDILLADLTKGRLHLNRISTRGSIGLISRAKQRGIGVTCGVTHHHLALTDQDVAESTYHPNWKMAPPLRTKDDVEAVHQGIYDGTVDVISSYHCPRHRDETDMDFSAAPAGAVGLETVVSLCLDRLVHGRIVGLSQLIRLLSTSPAQIFDLPGGDLRVGSPADITVLDLRKRTTVEIERFASKAHNTPLAGQTFKGAVAMTIIGGNVVYSAAGSKLP